MHMLYLLVIPTSKESGSYHEAEILSVLLQVSFYPLIRRGKLEGNCRMKKKHTHKITMLSIADSTVTHWAHFICSCSIRKCPQVVCNHTTCLPHLVVLKSTVYVDECDLTVAQTTSPSRRLLWYIKEGKMTVIVITLSSAPSCLLMKATV